MKAAICERPAAITPNTEKIAQTAKTTAIRVLRRPNERKLAANTGTPTAVMEASVSVGLRGQNSRCVWKMKIARIQAMNPAIKLCFLLVPSGL